MVEGEKAAMGKRIEMNGEGKYEYLDKDGWECECENWHDIPDDLTELTRFQPDYPPSPHTTKDHKYMDTFPTKFREVFERAKRNQNR